MKLIKLITAITLALVCAAFPSCSEDEMELGLATWYGDYPAREWNSDTGEWYEDTVCIVLQFDHSGRECIIMRGIRGLYAASRTKYNVDWSSREQFTLYDIQGGQRTSYYSGTINGDRMKFEFLSCDKVERIVELVKVINE